MNNALQPVITQAGWQAAIRAENAELKIVIHSIALGDKSYTVSGNETELQHECTRVAIAQSAAITEQQLQLTALVTGNDEYWVREIGIYLEEGTLFALWSDPDNPLAYKAQNVDLVLTLDLVLTALPSDNITIITQGSAAPLSMACEFAMLATTCIDTLRRQIQMNSKLNL